jgi:elongation factor Ts
VHVSPDAKRGAVLELNCETDFVAKNDDFIAFANRLAALIVAERPADVAALSALALDGSTVDSVRMALVGKIGENLSIRRFQRFETEGLLAAYVHGGAKIGAMVDLVGGDAALAKDLAMHIAARKPKALSKEGVPSELIETERRIATEKALESGKPAEIVAKTVEGTLQKFIKEVTLLGQPFIKDDKASVEQVLNSRKARVPAFALYLVGEGIERRETDFAAEVAAQAAAAAAAR